MKMSDINTKAISEAMKIGTGTAQQLANGMKALSSSGLKATK